jgi:prolipoprotein diacylglyceryltransferase
LLATVLGLAVIGIEVIIAVWRTFHDDLALRLTAVMMPYMALICTAAVASGVLNVRQHFAVPAAAPTILNVVMIVALVGGALLGGLTQASLMYLVCGGVLLAGVIQVGITGVALRRASFFPMFGGAWRDPQLRRVFALMAPMALGLGIGRLGCMMSGCCYGKPSDLPWAMMYPENPYIPAEIAGKRVHPSPIYEMIAAFAIAGILVYMERHKKHDGQIFWSFFLLYGLARFILEFWRGDAVRGFIIPDVISVSQGISVLTVIIAAIMLLRRPKTLKM